jgi:putative membrane protein
MMWHHDGWGGGGWLLMGLLMLLFWAVVVGAVVWAVRNRGTGHPHTPPPASFAPPGWGARQILDERFARGEISEEEYRQRRGVLEQP